MTREPNYSVEYPVAWREGIKRGRKGYNDGKQISKISTKSRFKDFWQKMAFKHGIAEGFDIEQQLTYNELL